MDFEKEWLLHFADQVSKSLLRKKVLGEGNFIWHIFSYNIVEADKYLTGDDARKAFDKLEKSGAKYF